MIEKKPKKGMQEKIQPLTERPKRLKTWTKDRKLEVIKKTAQKKVHKEQQQQQQLQKKHNISEKEGEAEKNFKRNRGSKRRSEKNTQK